MYVGSYLLRYFGQEPGSMAFFQSTLIRIANILRVCLIQSQWKNEKFTLIIFEEESFVVYIVL